TLGGQRRPAAHPKGFRMARLVECVPNFSEGRDRGTIDAIAQALSSVSGVKLLDVDPGADTNRTVYTLVGPPDGVAEAAFRGAKKASELIDMRAHKGAHPRMGALLRRLRRGRPLPVWPGQTYAGRAAPSGGASDRLPHGSSG
ncbi:MAG TPA: hypothetical protein VLN08_00875, partial [Vicinamibacterales bacterium]|nr:hypothetical protein [Vicinamibacterales bacterium]